MLSHSSSSNGSLVVPHLGSINSSLNLYIFCLISRPSSIIFTTSCITNSLLLLPLCIFILYHGFQQWKQKRSSAPTMSHSDIFTYNIVTTELMGVFGNILFCCGIFREDLNLSYVGSLFSFFLWYAQVFFHVLMCVERYLAVIHPITYRSLRTERAIRFRNISIGCAWLLSITGMGFVMIEVVSITLNFCALILSVAVVSFSSLSVLCVLIRPGPGEQGGDRERVDQSKQRAFNTIMVIIGALVVKFIWSVIWEITYMSQGRRYCLVMALDVLFNLPSSLVLPLLCLHRLKSSQNHVT